VVNEEKYNNILAGMRNAEQDSCTGPILATMYREWWDYAL
jgi:hypothetical protein